MASKNSLKPYKLVATNGPLSRDDLATWEFNQLSYCRQKEAWQEFLPGGTNSTWTATEDDDTNGIMVTKPEDGSLDVEKTNKKRSAFKDFLDALAINCPAGYPATVVREATSWKWVIDEIKKDFGLDTRGEQFLAGNDIKLTFDDTFTYQQGYMYLRDYYINSLAEKDTMFKGKKLATKEKMSPLAELFIVERWLAKIDPRLPAHVHRTRGHLFSENKPTIACNQRALCDQIDHMLAELDQASIANVSHNATAQVNVGYVPEKRAYGGGRYPPQRNMRGFRGQGRPPGPRQPRPASPHCLHCLEAKRYDASITHPSSRCPWVTQRPQQRQSRQPAPAFKVLLIPNQTTPAQSYQNPGGPDDTYADAHTDYDHSHHLPTYQGYDYSYQYQDEEEHPSVGGVGGYPPGTLEEL